MKICLLIINLILIISYCGSLGTGNTEFQTSTTTLTTTTIIFNNGVNTLLIGGTLADTPSDIEPTSDGGFIITGLTCSTDGDFIGQTLQNCSDIYVMKLTAMGSIDTSFGGGDGIITFGGTSTEAPQAIKPTSDEGFLIVGGTYSSDGIFAGQGHHGDQDIFIIKLTNDGNFDTSFGGGDGIIVFGGSGTEGVNNFLLTSDNGLIIAGFTNSTNGDLTGQSNIGNQDIMLLKFDSNGNLDSTFDGDGILLCGGTQIDQGFDVKQTIDNGYILIGRSQSNDGIFTSHGYQGSWDSFVIKIHQDGNLDAFFGGGDGVIMFGGTNLDYGLNILVTNDGGFMINGSTGSSDGTFLGQGAHGDWDFYTLKLTSTGSIDSSFATDGILMFGGSNQDLAGMILQTSDGGFILVGTTRSGNGTFSGQGYNALDDMYIIKLTNSGTFDSNFAGDGIHLIGGIWNDRLHNVIEVNGSYYALGYSGSNDGDFAGLGAHGDYDILLWKLNPDGTY